MPSTNSGPSREPIAYSGSLDSYKSRTVTPHIGTEFSDVQLTDLLKSDDKIRDLAVTVSRRGVVFFRNQDIDDDAQRVLGQKLGELTGKPQESTLHIHPAKDRSLDTGIEILEIVPERHQKKDGSKIEPKDYGITTARASRGWHSDITFEPVPSDYAILKILTPPENGGGDTLWASGYQAYEQLSAPYKKLLEELTAFHSGEHFHAIVKETHNQGVYTDQRGHPENKGPELTATHPVVRTNPVTGWKSVFINPVFTKKINGVTPDESQSLLQLLNQNLRENHNAQVRFKWNKNDVAIWDNRVTAHTATIDFDTKDRLGHRVLSIGEKPYLDVNSKGINEALAEEKAAVSSESTEFEATIPIVDLKSKVQKPLDAQVQPVKVAA